ncbi:hypothetical protein VP01_3122g1 [Puccinia sorghi]|uniref:Uncharacterized protein n=1 Tax=Puccinia sorghi TaxID=27349 RepID=A0A0L6UZF0_9BASI|nr:hypothetical protein VP01_3122g1 [Puccinia sorghi]
MLRRPGFLSKEPTQQKITGIPCEHQIAQLLDAGKRAEPDEFNSQWHLKGSASKRKIKLKTKSCEPSQFERILPKHVTSEDNHQNSKKMKVQPTNKVNQVQSNQRIPALLEAPQYLRNFIHQCFHGFPERNPQQYQDTIRILLESRFP